MSNERELPPMYETWEEFENARARFAWNDGDITWLKPDGVTPYTKEEVAKLQADARQADGEAEHAKMLERHTKT